jgi:methionine synthase / methylenetetrahydrofolate reductase(NADPH)
MNQPRSQFLIFDGGISTELYERGFYINRLFEELNLTNPNDVQAVHESYIKAGAEVITTNTFSCNAWVLDKFGLVEKRKEILLAGIRLAKAAASSNNVKVALSLGPSGQLVEPLGPVGIKEIEAEYSLLTQIAQSLPDNERPDFYILETFTSMPEMLAVVRGVRSVDQATPIIASATVLSADETFLSAFAEAVDRFNNDWQVKHYRKAVDWLGLNCAEGPNGLLDSLKILRPMTKLPILIQPNAGIPRNIDGRYFYMTSPDYLGKYAKRYFESGAQGVGGCCGTGPDHIRAVVQSVKMLSAKLLGNDAATKFTAVPRVELGSAVSSSVSKREWQDRPASRIGQTIREGKKVWTIELTSPKGAGTEKFVSALSQVKSAGIKFVNVPDGARASTRVSSLHLAAHVNSRPELGVTVIPHLTTRDRNLIALQADLLGAAINQVHDLLLITGDPPKLGVSKEATAVYDIDSIGLTYLVQQLNRGLSASNEELGSATQFGIGVAANPTAVNMDLELKRWNYKVESGADYAVTQPIYDPDDFLRWRDKIGKNYRPHIVGIWPFVSLKNAEFMAHEVPGVRVPEWAIQRMQKYADDPVASIQEGIGIAREVIARLEHECEGFAVSAPLGKVDVALEVYKR